MNMNDNSSLPKGYSFCRTALGQFAVRGPDDHDFAVVIIDQDGDIFCQHVPSEVVEAAIKYWKTLSADQRGCVREEEETNK